MPGSNSPNREASSAAASGSPSWALPSSSPSAVAVAGSGGQRLDDGGFVGAADARPPPVGQQAAPRRVLVWWLRGEDYRHPGRITGITQRADGGYDRGERFGSGRVDVDEVVLHVVDE